MSSAVPSVYPVDEEFIKLCMLDKLLNLGLAEQFAEEIQTTLAQIHRLSCLDDDILIQLSVQNYNFRQSIFTNELEELKRWDGEGLTGPNKIIFNALDYFVRDVLVMDDGKYMGKIRI
ncbi:hypothetical protein AgCh_027870 [Apium graveolens]